MSCKNPVGRTVVEGRASAASHGCAAKPLATLQNSLFAESDKDKSPCKNSLLRCDMVAEAKDSGAFSGSVH